jgi:hypothetical protein
MEDIDIEAKIIATRQSQQLYRFLHAPAVAEPVPFQHHREPILGRVDEFRRV